ncbi:MAG: hypothetical protein UT08_C0011G0025 [Candidatus Woesebacteria bacterium GW2011_GWB1_38_8]|uniref:Membrane-bound metal-dependent hydrolase n=2 Tax=Candidatus Woeseibacteriota TaxID=1752722 RepID=A0A0G0L1Y9_9BACT|nr:MAG: hypothetical protein UT08_C0011G0025 [Candidatus Woesebacteria bacterium GW2011_GWB1_38_8]OGM20476.1 MAG: hypothetical protein A2863_01435 [Candidatus Woesebacteria bacterium RIFCSPHIGHO2_01_FULL_38_9b]
MKKDVLTHFTFAIALFTLITVFKGWLELTYLAFWIGGIIGTLLPDVDYLIHVYVLNPTDSESQKTSSLVSQKQFGKTWDLLTRARYGNSELLFHSVLFQILFWLFTFLVITSSGSLLAKGIVLAFSLHLIIDQASDLIETGTLEIWFKKMPFNLDAKQKKLYLVGNILLLIIFSSFL